MPINILKHFVTSLRIDDEDITVHIGRMGREEAIEIEPRYAKFGTGLPEDTPKDERDKTEREAREFAEDMLRRYVSLPPGQIQEEGRDVTTGAELTRLFCARRDVLIGFYQLVYSENFLGKAAKNVLRLRAVLSPGSQPPIPTPPGAAPVVTAENAKSSSSANSEPAPDPSAKKLSGAVH